MTAQAKICGINSREAMDAAVTGGAAYIGLVFFPPSPRSVTPDQATALAEGSPKTIKNVGLFVEPDDVLLAAAVGTGVLDMIQLHGNETPARVREIKELHGLPVMKAFGLKSKADLASPADYFDAADLLLFDGLGDPDSPNPGGNAALFDWRLLADHSWPLPWMLAGGLTPENVGRAIAATGAPIVDVSSGVEAQRGEKDPALIHSFLEAVAAT